MAPMMPKLPPATTKSLGIAFAMIKPDTHMPTMRDAISGADFSDEASLEGIGSHCLGGRVCPQG